MNGVIFRWKVISPMLDYISVLVHAYDMLYM